MRTFTEIVDSLDIKIESTLIALDANDLQDEWKRTAFKYLVKIRYFNSQMCINYYKGSAHVKKLKLGIEKPIYPDVHEVLYSLVSDAQCLECSQLFDDFCDSLGYDSDSRKAEQIYKDVVSQTSLFKGLLGGEYHNLMNCEMDY